MGPKPYSTVVRVPEEAVEGLADWADQAARRQDEAETFAYEVSGGRWDDPAWTGPVARARELASDLARILPEAKWRHNDYEMTVTHSAGFGEALGREPERTLPDRALVLEPEEVDVMAERIAKGFERFVDSLRPFWSCLDSDELSDEIIEGARSQASGTAISPLQT